MENNTIKAELKSIPLIPDQKIKVFISSICGNEKYDKVRLNLKKAIESTNLADVYTFEGKGASTLSAGNHYTFALEDSDICIFLIDNADGINPGVQAEIDTVKKRKIKALYYFCDETSKNKTTLEQSLMGAQFAKSKTVNKFEDLSKDGALALINDITSIYHYYCKDKISVKAEVDDSEFQGVDIAGLEKTPEPIISKTVIKNIDKCSAYLLKLTTDEEPFSLDDEEKTSEIDEWCVQFFPILFESKSIRQFNTGMFLETLKNQQAEEHFNVIQLRWQAIQAYFSGDIDKCIEHLDNALKLAKDKNQPNWLIKDILIDLRNNYWVKNTINNRYSIPDVQTELTDSNEELYYPILDRVHDSLNEKYMEGLYKKKTASPYSVTYGSNLEQLCDLLASSFVIAMYNGSLTHILLIYEKIKDLAFYLSCKYDDWSFKRDLLKLAIFARKEKEIKGIQDSYPEILNNMSAEDAEAIMKFCDNHPIPHEKLISKFLAFGTIGYYLKDKVYQEYETQLLDNIKKWLDDENSIVAIGTSIFYCLFGVSHRISQDLLAEICCLFIDKHYSRWYMDMFRFIAKCININQMSESVAIDFLSHIISVIEDESDRKEIQNSPSFLYILRKQSKTLTETLNSKIKELLPDFYEKTYKLETTQNKQTDYLQFIQNYIQKIKKSNETQGKNGSYFESGTREIATIRSILLDLEFLCDSETLDSVVSTVSDTLLKSKESIRTKLDAISLLITVKSKYPKDYERNLEQYNTIVENKVKILESEHYTASSNIDTISLKLGLAYLCASMGLDSHLEILESMPYIQNDIATTITVEKIIIEYLEISDEIKLPPNIEAIVLQNVLQWLRSENLDVRWIATRILLKLSNNPENEGVVNHQILNLVDTENVYIKNLIMRNINETNGVSEETKNYVFSKCENDCNFVVRLVCEKEKSKSS